MYGSDKCRVHSSTVLAREVAKITVSRVCKDHDTSISVSFVDTMDDGAAKKSTNDGGEAGQKKKESARRVAVVKKSYLRSVAPSAMLGRPG